MTHSPRPLDHADLALTVMLQDAASGRRVLWIGDFTTGAPERLAEVAHEVCVLDTSGRSVRGREGGVQRKNYTSGDLKIEGRYDLIVVPEVEVMHDLPARLLELRDALGDGLLVVGSAADTARYESTWTALDADFREVQLFGQSGFSASAFASLDGMMADAALDASLIGAETEPVVRYVYLAGDELPKQSSLLVVQTRTSPVEEATNHREVDALRDELKRASSRLEQAQVRLVATEAELSEAQASLRAGQKRAEQAAEQAVEKPTTNNQEQRQRQHEEARRLLQRARLRAQVTNLETEVQRRGVLLRDVTEELGEWIAGRRSSFGSVAVGTASPSDASVAHPDELSESPAERALDTEAALAAAEFTIDELRAQVMSLQAAAESESAAEPEVSALEQQLAEERSQHAAVREAFAGFKAQAASNSEPDPEILAAFELQLAEARASLQVANAEAHRLAAAQAEMVQQLKAGEAKAASTADKTANQQASLERLQGEAEGLRFRLRDAEASAKAAMAERDQTQGALGQLDRLDDLQEEVEQLRQTTSSQTLQLVDLTRERDAIERASRDVRSALAARDALMTRLQMELAQQENASQHQQQRVNRLTEETERLRDGIVAAAGAVDSRDAALAKVTELETALGELEEALRAQEEALANSADLAEAQREHKTLTETLRRELATFEQQARAAEENAQALEARAGAAERQCEGLEKQVASLVAFRGAAETALVGARRVLDDLRVEASEGNQPRHHITAAGIDAPSEPDRQFKRELEDKDTLLRSLTAQLEERDDRIRAFSRRLEGEDTDISALELEERTGRLKEELFHERAAREAADERVRQLIRDSATSGTEEVEKRLEAKSAAYEAEQARRQSLETDVSSLRSACTKARQGLESLLEEADADDEAARQLGALVDILTRF